MTRLALAPMLLLACAPALPHLDGEDPADAPSVLAPDRTPADAAPATPDASQEPDGAEDARVFAPDAPGAPEAPTSPDAEATADAADAADAPAGRTDAGCAPGETLCGEPARCVDTRTDPLNCGGCSQRITWSDPARRVHAVCVGGLGVFACDSGWGDCDGNSSNGCEADLLHENANCGTCGTRCLRDQFCGVPGRCY